VDAVADNSTVVVDCEETSGSTDDDTRLLVDCVTLLPTITSSLGKPFCTATITTALQFTQNIALSIKIDFVSLNNGHQATNDIGTQWMLDLCNGIVKEGCGITNLQRERGSNGVWILQRN